MITAVMMRTVQYPGTDPLGYVISANSAAPASERESASDGGGAAGYAAKWHATASIAAATQPEAATLLNVHRASVQRARIVQDKAAPALVKRVDAGEVAVSVAAKIAELPMEEQTRLVDADEATLRGAVQKMERANLWTGLI